MSQKEEPREIEILSWMSDDPDAEENLYDFRAIPQQVTDEEDEVEVDPKASGAPESVESSESKTEQSPDSPASAEKASTPKPNEPSTPTSSSQTTTSGKEKQPA